MYGCEMFDKLRLSNVLDRSDKTLPFFSPFSQTFYVSNILIGLSLLLSTNQIKLVINDHAIITATVPLLVRGPAHPSWFHLIKYILKRPIQLRKCHINLPLAAKYLGNQLFRKVKSRLAHSADEYNLLGAKRGPSGRAVKGAVS